MQVFADGRPLGLARRLLCFYRRRVCASHAQRLQLVTADFLPPREHNASDKKSKRGNPNGKSISVRELEGYSVCQRKGKLKVKGHTASVAKAFCPCMAFIQKPDD